MFVVSINLQAQDLIESLDDYLVRGNTIQYLKENAPLTEDGSFILEADDGWVDVDLSTLQQKKVVPPLKNVVPAISNNTQPTIRNNMQPNMKNNNPMVNTSGSGFASTFAKSFAKGFVKGLKGPVRPTLKNNNTYARPVATTTPVAATPAPVVGTPSPVNNTPSTGNYPKGGGPGDRINNVNLGLNYDRTGKATKVDYNIALGTINNQTFKIAGDITSDESGNKLNVFLKYVDGNTNSQISINLMMNVVNTIINQLQIGLQYNENPDNKGLCTQDNLQKLVALRQQLSNKKSKVENTVTPSKVKFEQFFPAKGEE